MCPERQGAFLGHESARANSKLPPQFLGFGLLRNPQELLKLLLLPLAAAAFSVAASSTAREMFRHLAYQGSVKKCLGGGWGGTLKNVLFKFFFLLTGGGYQGPVLFHAVPVAVHSLPPSPSRLPYEAQLIPLKVFHLWLVTTTNCPTKQPSRFKARPSGPRSETLLHVVGPGDKPVQDPQNAAFPVCHPAPSTKPFPSANQPADLATCRSMLQNL